MADAKMIRAKLREAGGEIVPIVFFELRLPIPARLQHVGRDDDSMRLFDAPHIGEYGPRGGYHVKVQKVVDRLRIKRSL